MRTKLREKREKRYSQDEMADLMNLSKSAYSRIETGKSAWTEAQILLAAKILDCRPEEIMDDNPHVVQYNSDHASGIQHINSAEVLHELFERMDNRHQQNIERVLMLSQQNNENMRLFIQELPALFHQMLESSK